MVRGLVKSIYAKIETSIKKIKIELPAIVKSKMDKMSKNV